ncbi:hypothetical protein F3D3_0016 [Fusibacter sp. 3D3]|nr:hypothetical protein F3D3_0016 [Fusibacter sp. 3D3]
MIEQLKTHGFDPPVNIPLVLGYASHNTQLKYLVANVLQMNNKFLNDFVIKVCFI